LCFYLFFFFFFQAEDGIRDRNVTGVQTCALPISCSIASGAHPPRNQLNRRNLPGLDGPLEPKLLTDRSVTNYATGSSAVSHAVKIGRASCRERVEVTVVGVELKKRDKDGKRMQNR